MIGVVELEILNEAVAELYRPVMENGSAIYLVNQDRVISSADMDMLYKELQGRGMVCESEPGAKTERSWNFKRQKAYLFPQKLSGTGVEDY